MNLSQAQKTNRMLSQRIDDLECRRTHHSRFDSTSGPKKVPPSGSRALSPSISGTKKLTGNGQGDSLSGGSSSPCLSKISPSSDDTLLAHHHHQHHHHLSHHQLPVSPSRHRSPHHFVASSHLTYHHPHLRKNISEDSDDPSEPETAELSTPSTTRHSSMSIEKELEALRKDALSDTIDNFTAVNRHYATGNGNTSGK